MTKKKQDLQKDESEKQAELRINDDETANDSTDVVVEETVSQKAIDSDEKEIEIVENEATEADDEEEPKPDPTALQTWWAGRPKKINLAVQIAFGAVLVVICGFFLMRSGSETSSMWSLFVAFGAVLILPRVIEKGFGSSMPIMRRTILIGLVVVVILMVIIGIRAGGMVNS